jgi:hypothetical protein
MLRILDICSYFELASLQSKNKNLMATFSVIGKLLVDPEEIIHKKFSGELSSFRNLSPEALTKSDKSMKFGDEVIEVNKLASTQKALRSDFQPIGIGKPLSIEITTVYSGKYKKFLGAKKDAIVVSGVKNAQTFQGTSRAINIKTSNVNENDYLKFTAFEDGTRYVYYTPAMDANSMQVSFEIMFDNFDTALFETISALLTSAAGVPVFLPAAAYLLGGAQLVNIGSKLGDALFSGQPHLTGTIAIEFDSPLIPATEPKEFIIYRDADKGEFDNLEVGLFKDSNPALRLVKKADGSEYKGDAPYMIVILNGAKRQDLESFAPTLASASVLKKFYGPANRIGEVTTVLQDAMKLYNDSNYRLKGEKLKKQMDAVADKTSDEYKKLKQLYDAYAANIGNDNLKLPQV